MKIYVMWTGMVEVEAESMESALKKVVLDRDLMDVNTRVGSMFQGASFSPENDRLDHLRFNYAKQVLEG